MTKQLELWQGPFGDQYTDRNRPTEQEMQSRELFWKGSLQLIYTNCQGKTPKSILEIGAGSGPNLITLDNLYKQMNISLELYATEVNEKAMERLKENLPSVNLLSNIPNKPIADLAFTYGVLIHTHPAHLLSLQRKIYNASNRWIGCIEYFAPETRALSYRGESDALWLDDYGSKWIDNFNLRLIGYGFCWKRTTGLDNVTMWLFEKMDKMQ